MSSVAPSEISQILTRGVDLTARGEYAAALPILAAVYKTVPPEQNPLGLSAYGLCLSKVEHKNKLGAELCEKAMKLQSFEGLHWANLVRLYVGVKNRKKAVDVLESGLKLHPKDSKLLKIRDEIGYRKTPYLRFLSRTHPLNKVYSNAAGSMGKNARVILLAIGLLICVGIIAGVFLMVVK
jgi:tetratricopeptide (TPR) repeat protein